MKNEKTQNLAERLIALLQENDDDFLRASLEKINRRLDRLESSKALQNSSIQTSQTIEFPVVQSVHASQEKFLDLDELAEEVVNGLTNEKACPFEPAGKPCDNCAMCNSRGF